MIDPVTIRKVWSFGVNEKVLRDDSRIIRIWSALEPKKLGLRALNRMVYWETDEKISKAWKVRPKKLSTERLIDWGSMKA